MNTYLIVLGYLLVLVTLVIIIVNTNSTSKALAYMMLVLVFPVVGIIIYFNIGGNYRKRKLYQKKLKIDEDKQRLLKERLQKFKEEILVHSQSRLGHFQKLADSEFKEFILTSNQEATLLINGEEKFPRLLDDLRNAKQFIHIEYYIYEDDEIGNQVAEILMQKSKEGVEVRFIYDDFGSSGLKKKFKQKLKSAGVEAFPFYKVRWLLFANRINYRNHRKIVVIDGEIGYVGGINVSDKYINSGKNKLFWRDTHLRIQGLAVQLLQHAFLVDWNFCAQQNIPFSEPYFSEGVLDQPHEEDRQLVQIITSGPDSDYPNILFAMTQAIMLSKEEVLITTPYFIPEDSFLNAIKIASLSGVKIKILVPGVSDSFLVNLVSTAYYQELLEAGVEIYRYRKGFVHAKTMICDEQVSFVGTTNLDQRSFELNFEIHAIVYDKEMAIEHKKAMLNDFAHADKIDLITWKNRGKLAVFTEKVAKLVSPLM